MHRILAIITLALLAPRAIGQTLPKGADVAAQPGIVFAILKHDGAIIDVRDPARAAAIRAALAPLRRLSVGGRWIVLSETGLTDLARSWGSADRHGQGEAAYSVACWSSRSPGLQAAFVSALDAAAPYAINGWAVADERSIPPGCSSTPAIVAHRLPLGFKLGQARAEAERMVALRPTRRTTDSIEWGFVLPIEGGSETVDLRETFSSGRLRSVSFTTVETN